MILVGLVMLSVTGQFVVAFQPARAAGESLIISEFRLFGQNGANDEFVEVYNTGATGVTVNASDGSAGFALAASDGTARFIIPNGTTIPPGGHFLGVNSATYSLASYPAGNGTTATGNATYVTDIENNAGIALFATANPANFNLANRLDAVGSTEEANTLYKEGAGYPALTAFPIDYSFYRDLRPTGLPKDTNNNAADFLFVDTNGTSAGAGQRLGAPGPEPLSAPTQKNASLPLSLLAPNVSAAAAPNQVRDFTQDPANDSTFGTLDIRRVVTNNTGANVTRLRLRVIDLSTFPSESGVADLRPRTSTPVIVTVNNVNIPVTGTQLEQPPSQPNGGGFGSSLSLETVTLNTPIPPGGTLPFRVLLGIQQTGDFTLGINVEALSTGGSPGAPFALCGDTDNGPSALCGPTVTVNQAQGQADPTAVSPVNFTVVFSEPVTGLTGGDVSFAGSTAAGPLVANVTGGPTTYNVAVSGMTSDGTVVAALAAGAANDEQGDPSFASTSNDNTVTFFAEPCDLVPPPGPGAIMAKPGVPTTGTSGPDVIYGTSGPDQIAGLGGDDVIFGLDGNDEIVGGDGKDSICGGNGHDKLFGSDGDDTLRGGVGDDNITGGPGTDQLDGGSGTNVIVQ